MVQYIGFSDGKNMLSVVAISRGNRIGAVSSEEGYIVLHYPINEPSKRRCHVPFGSRCAYETLAEFKANGNKEAVYDLLEQHLRQAIEEGRI